MTTGTFQGTFPNPVAAGGTLIVRFYDPSRAGQTIQAKAVKVESGEEVTIPIVLDHDGIGGTKWAVPAGWGEPFVVLQEQGALDHTVSVV